MKIVYLHQYFNTPEMSGGTRSFEIAKHLVQSGHRVDVITTWRDETDARDWYETVESGVRVHWLPVRYNNKMTYSERMRSFLKFAVKSSAKALKLDPDVVFATSTPLTIAIPGILCSMFRRVPLVLEVRDLWPTIPIAMNALRNPAIKFAALQLEKKAYIKSEHIIALSPGMAEGVMRFGCPPEKVSVIPNFANVTHFGPDKANGDLRRKLRIRADQILLTYIGTFGKVNGVAYLADVAKQLEKDDRFRIALIGDGYEKDQIEKRALAHGVLDKNLFILPPVSKIAVPAIMADSDVSVSTIVPVKELEHNSANKFFDSLASGCCVAINHGGWQAALLQEAQAGIVLSRDPTVAARQLIEVADIPGEVKRMGVNARKLGEERFNVTALCSQVEAVLSAAKKS
jgi:glycosyltransferase involved in cell wall biosynthesis